MDTVVDFTLVGANIRRTRELQNMKQKELAEDVGTTAAHLSDIERGIKKASVEMLLKISNVLDTPVDNLLKGNPWVCRSYQLDSDILPLLNQCNAQSLEAVRAGIKIILSLQQENTSNEPRKSDRLI